MRGRGGVCDGEWVKWLPGCRVKDGFSCGHDGGMRAGGGVSEGEVGMSGKGGRGRMGESDKSVPGTLIQCDNFATGPPLPHCQTILTRLTHLNRLLHPPLFPRAECIVNRRQLGALQHKVLKQISGALEAYWHGAISVWVTYEDVGSLLGVCSNKHVTPDYSLSRTHSHLTLTSNLHPTSSKAHLRIHSTRIHHQACAVCCYVVLHYLPLIASSRFGLITTAVTCGIPHRCSARLPPNLVVVYPSTPTAVRHSQCTQ